MSESLTLTVVEAGSRFRAGETLVLSLQQCFRLLPGRREVRRASLEDGSIVLLKHYTHPAKARVDARCEWEALHRLRDSKLPIPQPLGLCEGAKGCWAVLSYFVERAVTLGKGLEHDEEKYLRRLVDLVQRTHDAAALQDDLHLGNYLLGPDHRLWIIDAGSHRFLTGKVTKKQRILNWALLRANLSIDQRPTFDRLFESGPAAALQSQVMAATPAVLNRRLRRYRAKCQRTCTDFVKCERGGCLVIRQRSFDPGWLRPLLESGVEELESEYAVLKRASGCLIVEGECDGCAWVLETHWDRGWCRIARQSRARRSWVAGQSLRLLGWSTPEPLAFWERREYGRLVSDGLLTVKVGGVPLQRWVGEDHPPEKRHRVARHGRRFFAALAEIRASHGDTQASNFHVGPAGDLTVIALSHFQWAGPRWRSRHKRDLQRFAGNAVKFPAGEDIFLINPARSGNHPAP